MNASNRCLTFFEDGRASQFSPIALLRPVFELRCGHFTMRERVTRQLGSDSWDVVVRPHLADVYLEEFPESSVNNWTKVETTPGLIVNGRWLGPVKEAASAAPGTAGWIGDELAWLHLETGELQCTSYEEFQAEILRLAHEKKSLQATGLMLQYPWDLIHHNPEWLTRDFRERRSDESQSPPEAGVVGSIDDIFIHKSAELDPFVVLDTRHGPIWIDAEAKIQAFTRIEGPAFIGRGTQTFRANIREGTTIGPVCRIGGEIEESILHAYANKYHDGFLGHSYVCPWVNLGALTTNSDLKNDYSNVSVPLAGQKITTDSNKVGCFIGDHTKTAICSLFNTGTAIGVMSMLLPGGELMPKHVPSFSRVWHGRIEELPDGTESAIATAAIAMSRRGVVQTPAMRTLLQAVYEQTVEERQTALKRQSGRVTGA